jgi:uncharacterized membrane protein required for colicin V production
VIQDFLQSATLFDVVIVLVAMGLFVTGWLQGAIRQLLGIAAFILAFLLAANLREPLGDFLARNWTFNDRGFNFLLAWLGLWLAWAITLQIAVQSFYRRIVIDRRVVIVDELIGGLLAAFQVLLVVSLLAIIFESYYPSDALPKELHDAEWARSFERLLQDSAIVGVLRDSLIPAILVVLGPLLPSEHTAPRT